MDGGCSTQFNGGDDTHDPCLAFALAMLGPGDVRGIKRAPSRPGKHMANLPRLHLSSRISPGALQHARQFPDRGALQDRH
jgi:hypothetical protein